MKKNGADGLTLFSRRGSPRFSRFFSPLSIIRSSYKHSKDRGELGNALFAAAFREPWQLHE